MIDSLYPFPQRADVMSKLMFGIDIKTEYSYREQVIGNGPLS
jgi:hypothetical protein